MFTRITWLLLLAGGLVLFAASLWIEAMVLDAFLPTMIGAFALASALEVIKAGVVVMRRTMRTKGQEVPLLNAWLLRFMLIGFSALCSLLYLTEKIYQPELESIRQQQLNELQVQHAEQRQQLRKQTQANLQHARKAWQQQTQQSLTNLQQQHEQQVNKLQNLLNKEMNNTVNGKFKGPRYHAISERLQQAYARYPDNAEALRQSLAQQQQQQLLTIEQAAHQAESALLQRQRTETEQLTQKDFSADQRIEHPMVSRFLQINAAVFDPPPTSIAFTWFFALTLSLLMELGIFVTFDTLAQAWAPLFSVAHKADIDLQKQRIKHQQALRKEQSNDAYHRARTRQKRQHTEQSLQEAADDLLQSTKPQEQHHA